MSLVERGWRACAARRVIGAVTANVANNSDKLPLTRDLRLWVDGTGTFYDLRRHAMQTVPFPSWMASGDALFSSPDGAFMLASAYTSASWYSDGWHDGSTGQFSPLPTGLLNNQGRVNLDEHGSVALVDAKDLYSTADWSVLGHVDTSGLDGLQAFRPRLSPDGRRAYVALLSNVLLQMDPMGTTLFLQGHDQLIVLPIPEAWTGRASAGTRAAAALAHPLAPSTGLKLSGRAAAVH